MKIVNWIGNSLLNVISCFFILYLLIGKCLELEFSSVLNVLTDFGILQCAYLEGDKIVTVSNVKLDMSYIWEGVQAIGGAAVFSVGVKSASGFISKSGLPPTVKMGFVLASGAASYFTFETSKSIWKGVEISKAKPTKVDVTISQNSTGNFSASSPLEDSWFNDYVTNLLDTLNGILNIQKCVFVLINLIIIFLIMKKLFDKNMNLEWLIKYKYGKSIQYLFIKLQKAWINTNNLFLNIGIFSVWIFTSVNMYFIGIVLERLQSLLK